MSLKFVRFYVLVILAFLQVNTYAQKVRQIQEELKIKQQLRELQRKDDLTEWLYLRMDYNYSNPQQLLPFLMDTQTEVWRQPANEAERTAWLLLLSNQGYYQLQSGDILNSINCYENAYTYYYKYKLKQFDIVEYVLKPLSNNYTRLGDYERAIFIQQKVIRLNSTEQTDEIAAIYSNMAISWYSMGNYIEARRCIDMGLKLAKTTVVRFGLNNILSDILYEKNELDKALPLILRNISSLKSINAETAYGLIGSYTTLGNIKLRMGLVDPARQNFNKALNLIDTWYPGGKLRERANLIARLGKIEQVKNQPQKAIKLFDEALRLLRVNTSGNQTQEQHIYGENKLVEIFKEKASTYMLLKKEVPALENMGYALLAMDKIRKEFADDKTKERLQQEAKEIGETAIEMSVRLYSKTGNRKYLNLVLEIAERTKSRTLADQIQKNNQQMLAEKQDTTLRKRLNLERAIVYNERLLITGKKDLGYQKKIDALKFDLALLNKGYREQAAESIPSATGILMALPKKLHVLEFFFGTHSVYAIDIKNRKIDKVSRIGSADSLRKQINFLVNTYYQNGPSAMINSPKVFYTLSNAVYTSIFMNSVFGKNEHLCIVPDDVLGYLSFDGLITNKKYIQNIADWPFLIKKITTSYAFSLHTLLKNTNVNSKNTDFSGLFITHQNNGHTPIVAVKKEAESIKKLVKGTYIYDDAVNANSFFSAFESSSVLHISSHAYLSGPNKEPTLDFGKEKLFLFELLAKKNKPNLIVLSACRTGDGLLTKGEGIISLSRGFSSIGTPATIAGLWNVNDDATAQITANLYRHLINGQNTDEALHLAKLDWLTKTQASGVMYLPYYWDSLILMGSSQRIHLNAVDNGIFYWIIAGLFLILIVVFFRK